jgi:ABC-type sugar transport system ATPase subunit
MTDLATYDRTEVQARAPLAVEMIDIVKTFPGVRALDNVSFDLAPGEVHALLGENGAGKSTLIKILAGAYRKDSGQLLLAGREVSFGSPGDAIKAGVKVVFQEISLIPEFTVAENIFMEDHPRNRFGIVKWGDIRRRAKNLFARAGFDLDPDARVESLPVSQQQLVEISRALAYDSRVVVMDEPTSSLTPAEVKHLFAVIRRLKSLGIGIIYVSHKLEEVFEISDRATVLRDGRWVSTRSTAEHTHASLIKDMVGREIKDLFPRTRTQTGDLVVKVSNLSTPKKLKDVSFSASAGEVVGFFGLMGAGRTELAKAIVGYDPISAGSVAIAGTQLKPHSTTRSKALGIGLLTEDRKSEGLMLDRSVLDNLTITSLGRFSPGGFVDRQTERAAGQSFVDRFRIKLAGVDQPIRTLSGGNQQKVLLSRWLMYGLRAIVVDEPTRGIDVGAKTEIFTAIDDLAARGLAVIMMTSEMPELLGLSDRIYVLADGRITAMFTRAEATQEKILNAAIG